MESACVAREGAARPAASVGRSLDITVLMGGPSAEREVSLVSGRAIAEALRRNGHKVTASDIGPDDTSALDRPGIDVVFIALHGAFGESGEVQQLCEDHGLCYTGSGPRASWLAINKVLARECFQQAGMLCAAGVHVPAGPSQSDWRGAVQKLGLPAVIKPVDGGSSVDLTIAHDAGSRDRALSAVLGKYGQALVEQYIAGWEVTVGVLGEQALPPLRIIPAREFYDYTAKYDDNSGTRYEFELGVAPQVNQSLAEAALRAHQALGCRDMSRVDFILAPDGRCFLLEVNTIPGFTGHSLLPMAARKAGLSFDQLVDRLAQMALARRVSRR
jgi:D-alanine-D-alanine ligase